MDGLAFDLSTLTRDKLQGVGFGLSSEVVHITGTNVVAKISGPQDLEDQKAEKRIFERLQRHPNILTYFGQSPQSCTLLRSALLFEYHSHGSLVDCLDKLKTHPRKDRWPTPATSAVAYIHSKGIVHADIGLHNFLLHDDGRIILCDFAGSGLDDLLPSVSSGVRYANPLFVSDYSSERDDIFGLGTVLYELDRGGRIFDGKNNQEIRKYFRNKEFPDLSHVTSPSLIRVIENCWKTPGYKASDALVDLES